MTTEAKWAAERVIDILFRVRDNGTLEFVEIEEGGKGVRVGEWSARGPLEVLRLELAPDPGALREAVGALEGLLEKYYEVSPTGDLARKTSLEELERRQAAIGPAFKAEATIAARRVLAKLKGGGAS